MLEFFSSTDYSDASDWGESNMEKSRLSHGFSVCLLSQEKWLKLSGWCYDFSSCVNHKQGETLQLKCRVPWENPVGAIRIDFVTETSFLWNCPWRNTTQYHWAWPLHSFVCCNSHLYDKSVKYWWIWIVVFYVCFGGGCWPKGVVEDQAEAVSHVDWNFSVLPYF